MYPQKADTVPLPAFVNQYANMPSISNAGLINTIAREKAGGLGLDVYIFSCNQKRLAFHGHVANSMRLLKLHKYGIKSGHLRILTDVQERLMPNCVSSVVKQ